MSTETLPLMVDADIRARLERVAAESGHSASALAGAVLRDFLDESDQFAAMVQVGIDEADAGELIDFDVVKARVQETLERRDGIDHLSTNRYDAWTNGSLRAPHRFTM